MSTLKSLVILAICVICGPGISAQSASAPTPLRNDTMHLTVHTSISGTEVKAGDKLSITFDITPKRNMHVYAPGKHDYQVIAVKIDPQPWLKVAPTTYPPPEIYYFKELDERVETYGHPFKLVQDLTVLNTAAAKKAMGAGPIKVSAKLEYQACDDKVCYAPSRIPVTFDLTVK